MQEFIPLFVFLTGCALSGFIAYRIGYDVGWGNGRDDLLQRGYVDPSTPLEPEYTAEELAKVIHDGLIENLPRG